jgi:hypothetical protein
MEMMVVDKPVDRASKRECKPENAKLFIGNAVTAK